VGDLEKIEKWVKLRQDSGLGKEYNKALADVISLVQSLKQEKQPDKPYYVDDKGLVQLVQINAQDKGEMAYEILEVYKGYLNAAESVYADLLEEAFARVQAKHKEKGDE
jgi:hypothetical protein